MEVPFGLTVEETHDPRNYIPSDKWAWYLQDMGCSKQDWCRGVASTKMNRVCCGNDDDSKKTKEEASLLDYAYQAVDGRYYRGLYQLARKLEQEWRHRACWYQLPDDRIWTRNAIAQYIFENRVSRPRSELHRKSPFLNAPRERNTVYVLEQASVIEEFIGKWGLGSELFPPFSREAVSPNSRMRLFGLLARKENHHYLPKLLQEEADSASKVPEDNEHYATKMEIMRDLAKQFNNPDTVISHPSRKEKIRRHEGLKPNSPYCIETLRDVNWIEYCYDSTCSMYHYVMKLWMDDSTSPWRDRVETEHFADYINLCGREYLSWIYMKDVEAGLQFVNLPSKTVDMALHTRQSRTVSNANGGNRKENEAEDGTVLSQVSALSNVKYGSLTAQDEVEDARFAMVKEMNALRETIEEFDDGMTTYALKFEELTDAESRLGRNAKASANEGDRRAVSPSKDGGSKNDLAETSSLSSPRPAGLTSTNDSMSHGAFMTHMKAFYKEMEHVKSGMTKFLGTLVHVVDSDSGEESRSVESTHADTFCQIKVRNNLDLLLKEVEELGPERKKRRVQKVDEDS